MANRGTQYLFLNWYCVPVLHGSAESKFTFLIILAFLTPALLISGCATTPPLSEFENSLITNSPQKTSVVIYRSIEESWMHNVFINVLVDGHSFTQLKRGEYVQIYLPIARHGIKVEYPRYSGAGQDPEDLKMIDLKPGQVLYIEIVPGFEGMTWGCVVAYFPICVPLPAPIVDLYLKTEEDARKIMGKAMDRELLRERKMIQH